MLRQMMVKEEKCFWHRQDLASSKALELGVPPEDVQMEEVGEWVTWGPVIEPAPEGPPLAPLGEAPSEETGTTVKQEGGAMVDDDAVEETALLSASIGLT